MDEEGRLSAVFENMSVPKVHIIILNWNGKADTLECLESVTAIDYPNYEIVVVDNGSTDGSEEAIRIAFPNITFIQTGENLGFAEGNNVGIRYAMEQSADYVFVLNNDTTVDSSVLAELVNAAETIANAVILGPKIYFYDRPAVINSAGGSIDYETLKRGHIGYGHAEDGVTYSEIAAVEWITGCALLMRVSALKEIGLFDPDYFLICEELDLCARVRKRGHDVLFVPTAKIWHKVSSAFEGHFSPVYCYYMYRNTLIYVHKHYVGSKLRMYWKLIKESREFYLGLKAKGNTGYKKKAFCISVGTIHFFIGVWGRAPSWVFSFLK